MTPDIDLVADVGDELFWGNDRLEAAIEWQRGR